MPGFGGGFRAPNPEEEPPFSDLGPGPGLSVTMFLPPSNRNPGSKRFFFMQRDPEIKLANGLQPLHSI